MTEYEVSTIAVDAPYKVHTTVGLGLLESVHVAVLAYLSPSGKRLGPLLNFGLPLLKDGVTRVVNGLPV